MNRCIVLSISSALARLIVWNYLMEIAIMWRSEMMYLIKMEKEVATVCLFLEWIAWS